MTIQNGTIEEDKADATQRQRDLLLLRMSTAVVELHKRLMLLEDRAAHQASEIEDFRAIADTFARFIGERS